jgi:hypothetical protein
MDYIVVCNNYKLAILIGFKTLQNDGDNMPSKYEYDVK